MNWRLKLSNWLSGGALDRYQKQVELTKTKAQEQEAAIEQLKAQIKQERREIKQLSAQLQINQGFQVELGETQIKLQAVKGELERCQQKLPATEKELQQVKQQFQEAQQQLSKSQNWIQQLHNTIEVVNIEKRLPKQEFDTLWGFGIGAPKVDSEVLAGAITIKGWVLGKSSPVSLLRVVSQEQMIGETVVDLPRPAITQHYPDIPKADQSGFEIAIAVDGIPQEAELELLVVLEDQSVLPICAICLKRK